MKRERERERERDEIKVKSGRLLDFSSAIFRSNILVIAYFFFFPISRKGEELLNECKAFCFSR